MFGNPAELQSRCFPFVLDKGLLLAFNRAIGEPAQREIIPLTYIMAADQFDPRFDRRPNPGSPGSSKAWKVICMLSKL